MYVAGAIVVGIVVGILLRKTIPDPCHLGLIVLVAGVFWPIVLYLILPGWIFLNVFSGVLHKTTNTIGELFKNDKNDNDS